MREEGYIDSDYKIWDINLRKKDVDLSPEVS